MNSKTTYWKSKAALRLVEKAQASSIDEAIDTIVSGLLHGVRCPSTDLDAICPKLDIKQIVEADIPYSGRLLRVKDGFKIEWQRGMASGRRRFTVAHEMGHAIFETTGGRCPRKGKELERLCDMLATEILMPRRIFNEHAGQIASMSDIQRLTHVFQTSLLSTIFRAYEYNPIGVFTVDLGRRSLKSWGVSRSSMIHVLKEKVKFREFNGKKVTFQEHFKLRRRYSDCSVELVMNGSDRFLGLVTSIDK